MPHSVVEKVLPVSCLDYSLNTGTWTETDTSGVITQVKTTADNSSIVRIPINLERVENSNGVKITKIETLYKVGTADLDASMTVKLVQVPIEAGTSVTDITTSDDFAKTATSGLVLGTTTVTYDAFDRIEANNDTDNAVSVPASYYLEITVPTDDDNSFQIGDTAVYYEIEE